MSWGRILVLLFVLGIIDLTSAAAQTKADSSFLFYARRIDYHDTVASHPVFEFDGYVELRGAIAHFEFFTMEWERVSLDSVKLSPEVLKKSPEYSLDRDSGVLRKLWPWPRVQNVAYKLNGVFIEPQVRGFERGLILISDTVNWSQLEPDGVKFLLIPYKLSGTFKPFSGTWSLATSNGNNQIMDFESKSVQHEPYWSRQYTVLEWTQDRQCLPLWVSTRILENGTQILSALDVYSLHWSEKRAAFVVDGFTNRIDRRTKVYRFSGTFEKLAPPPLRVVKELKDKLQGDWVSVGTWGIDYYTKDTAKLNNEFSSVQIDKKKFRVTGLGKNAMNFDLPWHLSNSGRHIMINRGSYPYVWPFWFAGDTLIIRLTVDLADRHYYLNEIRFRRK